jgi:hypothetical protein
LAVTRIPVFASLCIVLVSVAVVHIGVISEMIAEADKNRIKNTTTICCYE